MPVRQNKALALLQKVNSQLKGERVPLKTKEEDELAVYLSGLTQKTQLPRAVNFEDFGDISISSGTDPRNSVTPRGRRSASPASVTHKSLASKFLKKKTSSDELKTRNASQLQQSRVPLSSSNSRIVNKTTLKSESESDEELELKVTSKNPSKNSTKFLKSKVAENDQRNVSPQFKSTEKKKGRKSEIVRTLGSVYLSSDEESLAEFIQNLSTSDTTVKQPKNLVAKKHQKWHKKTEPPAAVKKIAHVDSSSPFKRTPSPSSRLSRSHSLDSDLVDSVASEIVEDIKGKNKSSGLDDPFHVNLKDVSSLLASSTSPTPRHENILVKTSLSSSNPSPFKATSSVFKADGRKDKKTSSKSSRASPRKSHSKINLLENLGIHMVDELIAVNQREDQSIDLLEESEIETEKSEDKKRTLRKQNSESLILTEVGDMMKKNSSPLSSENNNSRSEMPIKVRKSEYTDYSEYSESFISETDSSNSKTVSENSMQKPERVKPGTKENSLPNKRKKHKIVLEEREVDISTRDYAGATHHWNTKEFLISGPYGLQYIDPKPVATHVISADALEALTAYSPNMLALQEMMKAQLELVRNFVAIQTRIYQSCLQGLNTNYKYTTLEDTKEYIRQHRKNIKSNPVG